LDPLWVALLSHWLPLSLEARDRGGAVRRFSPFGFVTHSGLGSAVNVIITANKEKLCAKVNMKCLEFSGGLPSTWCRRCQLHRKRALLAEDEVVVKSELEKCSKALTTIDRMVQTRAWKKRNNNHETDTEMLEWPHLWDDIDRLEKDREVVTKSGAPPRSVMDADSEATICADQEAVGCEGVEGVWKCDLAGVC
jgi:hypothetical protein